MNRYIYVCLILVFATSAFLKVYAGDVTGELLRDTCDGNKIYWVQSGKKYYIPNMDIINHMKAHGIPNWDSWRDVCGIPASSGPPFYYKDSRSDGLLIKIYQQASIYLIDNAQKRLLVNEYSFENYKYKGIFLSWDDIISVTSDICSKEFPTGSEINLVPTLSSPFKGASFTNPTVKLYWNPHPNPAWKYHLQVDNDSNFSSPIYDNSNLSTTSQSVTVPSSGRYYWRVRGTKSGRAPSDWSAVWYFDVELTGFASVSSGVTVTPSTIYEGDTFNVTFTLKEIQGAPITFTKIVCAILDEKGNHLFDLQDYSSITLPARGTWKYTGSGYLDDASTYQAVARGKVTDWFDFKTVDAGVNPRVFHVLPNTGTLKVTTNRSDATFSISGPQDYEGSGTSWTKTGAPVGTYTIEFHNIHTPDGYGYGVYPQPPPQTLTAGGTITFNGDYQQQYEPPIPLIENGPALSGHINPDYYQKYKFAVVADGRKYTMTLTPQNGNPDLYYANHDEGINPFDPGTYDGKSTNPGISIDEITFTAPTDGVPYTVYMAVLGVLSSDYKIQVTSMPTRPNLQPHQPPDWDNEIIVSSNPGDHKATPVYAGQPIYFDYAFINNSDIDITTSFQTYFYIDGAQVDSKATSSLSAHSYDHRDDFQTTLSAGNHQIKMVVDATEVIDESSEGDNVYEITIVVNKLVPRFLTLPLATQARVVNGWYYSKTHAPIGTIHFGNIRR